MFTHPFTTIWSAIVLASVLLQTTDARAASPGEMQTGSLLMRMAEGYETATLLNTNVNIDVNGLVDKLIEEILSL